MSKVNVYIGTDTKRNGQGVYRMVFDTLKGSLEGRGCIIHVNR